MAPKIVPTIVFGPDGTSLELRRPPVLATKDVRDDEPVLTPGEWLLAALALASGFVILAIIAGY